MRYQIHKHPKFQRKNRTIITMKQYTKTHKFNELLNQFDKHLQNTINCYLVKYECSGKFSHDNRGEYITHYFYIRSADGNVLLHKPQEETQKFWGCGIYEHVSGAAYPDGSLIKDLTMIITVKAYI